MSEQVTKAQSGARILHPVMHLHPLAALTPQLLQVVKGPVTKYFPANCRRVGFSYSSPEVVKLAEFVRDLPDDVPAVFSVGAMAHGKIDVSYVDQMISVSEYPLSAACCISRITNAFELKWDIV